MKNPNGYGTVYKLSGNRRRPFVARVTAGWTAEGKQICKTIGYYKSRKEANIALAEYNQNPYDIDVKKLTFAEVYEKWAARKFPQVNPHRARQYGSMFKMVAEFHDLYFADIKLIQIQRFFDNRTDISSASLAHYKALFNQLYKFAIKHEIVTKNQAEFVEIRKTEEVNPHTTFTAEELLVLWENSDKRDIRLILILIYSGMRINELLSMRKESVFLDERYMIGGSKTDAGKNRVIPIHKRVLPFITDLMQNDSEFLVSKAYNSGKSAAYTYTGFRSSIWRPVMARLNMSHTIHDTRHTFVSLMDAAGANSTALKRIVGHKDADITGLYTHKTIAELVAEVDKI